jgi:hypothetical protein
MTGPKLYVPKQKKDLLIGAADLYGWEQVKVWARSIKESGFTGNVVLLVYRVQPDVIENCEKLGIEVYQIGHDSFGRAISHNNGGRDTQAHQMRFFHAWQFLHDNNNFENYGHVIITDVRDVWFQKNPQEWLNPKYGVSRLDHSFSSQVFVESSEGIKYGNEAWGADNMLNGFGPFVLEASKDWTIYNVGVVAGKSRDMMGLFLTLYNLTVGRYIPSDQSAYNILVNQTIPRSFIRTSHADGWACQCGTVMDPQKSHYLPHLVDGQPVIRDGVVISMPYETPFHIVHQWDRVPEIKTLVESRYL